MTALFISAIVVFAVYIVATIVVFLDFPKSISETYYLWYYKDKKHLFTFFMWICSLLLITPWIEVSRPYTECLAFMSCAAMMFVGTACQFKEKLTNIVHYTSAGIWAVCAILWVILNDASITIAIGGLYGLTCFFIVRKSFTFFAEIACVIMMMAAIAKCLLDL